MKSSQQMQAAQHETRRVSEWSVGYRIAGPMVVFLALVLGAAQWVRSGPDVSPAGEQAQVESSHADSARGGMPDVHPAPALVDAYRKTLDAAE